MTRQHRVSAHQYRATPTAAPTHPSPPVASAARPTTDPAIDVTHAQRPTRSASTRSLFTTRQLANWSKEALTRGWIRRATVLTAAACIGAGFTGHIGSTVAITLFCIAILDVTGWLIWTVAKKVWRAARGSRARPGDGRRTRQSLRRRTQAGVR